MPTERPRAAVLDACVLVPRGLRDVLLSVAGAKAYRPLWTDRILAEARRNAARVMVGQGWDAGGAAAEVARSIAHMNSAFPDACLASDAWVPLVAHMTNHPGDRHVLAAAVGAGASRVVTENVRHFPVGSRPQGVSVLRPDAFLLECLASDPSAVLAGVEAMAARHRRPPHTVLELVRLPAGGRYTAGFGAALLRLNAEGKWEAEEERSRR